MAFCVACCAKLHVVLHCSVLHRCDDWDSVATQKCMFVCKRASVGGVVRVGVCVRTCLGVLLCAAAAGKHTARSLEPHATLEPSADQLGLIKFFS